MKKILIAISVLLIIGLGSAYVYLKLVLPVAGEPLKIQVELTPERIARGEYLANAVSACMDCHSARDWNLFSGPLKAGTLGQGGEEFTEKFGFPGNYYSKNITPHSLQNWTDGEILRAMVSGVNKNGDALFPVMPYPAYSQMAREDLYSIIAYLRTLKSVDKANIESSTNFPMNFILNTIPKEAILVENAPDKSDMLAYGKYVFTIASCADCHTKTDKGKPVEGMELAGGFAFPLPGGGTVYSSNITPDMETGIGTMNADAFVARFKAYADTAYVSATVKAGEFNTIMPWTMYGHMEENDLRAIFAYLQSVRPVSNKVTKFVVN